MPVRRVAGQAGDFQAHHQPGPPEPHVTDELLKAFAIGGRRAGLPEVAINHHYLLNRPAERDGALPERILALGALRVFDHLPQRRLPNVQIRLTPEMPWCDLVRVVAGYLHVAS